MVGVGVEEVLGGVVAGAGSLCWSVLRVAARPVGGRGAPETRRDATGLPLGHVSGAS